MHAGRYRYEGTMEPITGDAADRSPASLDLVPPVCTRSLRTAGMESASVCNTGGYALPTLANLDWGYATVRE